jgi:hypothetical protein
MSLIKNSRKKAKLTTNFDFPVVDCTPRNFDFPVVDCTPRTRTTSSSKDLAVLLTYCACLLPRFINNLNQFFYWSAM